MKVILIQPPIRDFYDTNIRLQPLGLCMLKAVVKKMLPEVELHVKDYHQGHGRKTVSLPSELSYLREYYSCPDASPFSTFHNYYHFGASFEAIGEDMVREAPDLVGISSLFSPYYREVLACAREIKRRLRVPIIIGGSHVSAAPLSILTAPDVDFIIRGEGERPFVEFLRAFRSGGPFEGIPNLGFKRGEAFFLNPQEDNYRLHELPMADFSDLPPDRYLYGGKPLCFLTMSRGCPHQCDFCSVHLTFGQGYQRRSPEDVLWEIKKRYREGYRTMDFEDDNLTYDSTQFRRLLRGIIQEFPPHDLGLFAMNGISYQSLDKETLCLMKKAGFTQLNLSLVSIDTGSLGRMNRSQTVTKFLEMVRQSHSLGLQIIAYQILGLPHEGLSQMIHTMAVMASLPVIIGPSVFYLTPGCPMAREFPEMTPEDMFKSRSTAMAVETANFSRDDIYSLFITARILNFLKGFSLKGDRTSMNEVLNGSPGPDKRQETGQTLLKKLLREGRLYAATRQGLRPLPRFKTGLFSDVLKKAGSIMTREGKVIDVG